jgi:hypothetical protein
MKSIYLYAQNASLFQQYLYVDTYVQCITNSAAQQATHDSVQLILDTYGANYRNQANFNYISYFYLIADQLTATQAALIEQYPESSEQIIEFFAYLQNRVTKLLA